MNDNSPLQTKSAPMPESAGATTTDAATQVTSAPAPETDIRMLYLVGGRGMAKRVDLSDLFARRLAGKGFVIDWIVFDEDPGPAWRKTSWCNADTFVVGRSRLGGLAGAIISKLYEMGADLRTFWLALTGKYDVVQVRDKFLVGALGLMAARIRGIRFTYWMSYPFAECRIIDAREGRARIPALSLLGGKMASWLLYRIILPRADHVFVQSQQMLQDVAAHGIDEASMTPVPMGIGEQLLDLPPLPVQPNTIVYLGTLNLVRQLDTLVHALAIVRHTVPDVRLTFIGDGDVPEDRRRLEQAIAQHGMQDAVEITGWLPVEQAHERVRRAAVCVSPFYPTPILLSTSPTKLIEYMALGRPVVANEHPEQSLIIAESKAGICVPWSAENFARAIASLLADPEQAERMAQRGREYVQARRLYSQIAELVAREYVRLVPVARANAR